MFYSKRFMCIELLYFEISLSVCDNLCKKIAFKRSYMDHLKDIVEDMFD